MKEDRGESLRRGYLECLERECGKAGRRDKKLRDGSAERLEAHQSIKNKRTRFTTLTIISSKWYLGTFTSSTTRTWLSNTRIAAQHSLWPTTDAKRRRK